jgi:hypothetical protein
MAGPGSDDWKALIRELSEFQDFETSYGSESLLEVPDDDPRVLDARAVATILTVVG